MNLPIIVTAAISFGFGMPLIPTGTETIPPIPVSSGGGGDPSFTAIDLPETGDDIASGPIGSFGPLPQFLKDTVAYIPNTCLVPGQGFKLKCDTVELPYCVYYIVFQSCGSCSTEYNGGLTSRLTLASNAVSWPCGPRFSPSGIRSYPTSLFKVTLQIGDEHTYYMDRPANSLAIFDGSALSCPSLLSMKCAERYDCVTQIGCADGPSLCPPRPAGPFTEGACTGCWDICN